MTNIENSAALTHENIYLIKWVGTQGQEILSAFEQTTADKDKIKAHFRNIGVYRSYDEPGIFLICLPEEMPEKQNVENTHEK